MTTNTSLHQASVFLCRPSEFARSETGFNLERRLWAEFVELWKKQAGSEVDAALA